MIPTGSSICRGRNSHIRLSEEQGRRAEQLIREAAEEFGVLVAIGA